MFHKQSTESNNAQQGQLTASGKPVCGLTYRCEHLVGLTDENGHFSYIENKPVEFMIEGRMIVEAPFGNHHIETEILEPFHQSAPGNQITRLLVASDTQPGNTAFIQAPKYLKDFEIVYFKVNRHVMPLPFKSASLGINLSAPQAEVDDIHQPQAFVDIFRGARPFAEYSDTDIIYDENGWPIHIPEGKKATTLLLQGVNAKAIPFGHYTVIYEGEGEIQYSGIARLVEAKQKNGRWDIIHLDSSLLSKIQRMILTITRTNRKNPIRNIRVVMPGGISPGNPYNRVTQPSQCPDNQFISFAELLEKDRNHIVFNPDYLNFMRNFATLRMMNFMEACPRAPLSNAINPCKDLKGDDHDECLLAPREWKYRAKMDHATWGGSYKTIVTRRFGVPVEVTIALANQLDVNPWYIIPHNATNDFVYQFAQAVKQSLKPNLRVHIEYTNEYWNNFWGSRYVRLMGEKKGLHQPVIPYRNEEYTAKVRYYSQRAVEIFSIWEQVYNGDCSRIYRILGSYTNSHTYSQDVLEYNDAFRHSDAVAIAPYFHGAWSRQQWRNGEIVPHPRCSNHEAVPKVFAEARTVDDIFDVMEQTFCNDHSLSEADKGDPYGIDAIIQQIQKHAEVASQFNVDLVSYEGGQHLVTHWGDKAVSDAKKKGLQDFFETANRDDRMTAKYFELLNAWKESGGKLFTLFTAPQSFNRYGMFGLKEHLNQARQNAPKFDAAMQFQEQTKCCWWDDE